MQPFPGRFLLLEVIEQRTERRRLPAKLDAGSDPCGLQRLLDELSRAMQASLERVNQPAGSSPLSLRSSRAIAADDSGLRSSWK